MRIGIFGGDTGGRTIDDVVADAAAAERTASRATHSPRSSASTRWACSRSSAARCRASSSRPASCPTYSRHPLTMAQQALTVQAASGGRFTLGIGLSHQIVIENMFGLSFDKPLRHMREYLAVLMPLLTDGKADVDGETISTHAAVDVAEPRPCPGARRRARPEDARARRHGHRRHRHVDDRPGHARVAHRAHDHRGRRARRPPGAADRRPACRSASPPTSTAHGRAPRRTSRSTASCRRTAPCSTAKAPTGRPTSRSSATKPRSRRASASSPTPA